MMEEKLEFAVKQLKKNSNSSVYNALLSIRTKYLKEDDGVSSFRTLGGLPLLLYHIQKPNHKIAELAMSILGNCCLEPETRITIHQLKGIRCIVSILESLEKESILNRACRTLANLALYEKNAEEMSNRNVAKTLIDFLATASDTCFKQSVLRALRILCSASGRKGKAIEFGVAEALGKMLVSTNNDDEAVLLGILRCLALFSTDCCSECGKQMQNVECLQKLVSLASDEREGFKEHSLHVLANLSRQEMLRSPLGSAGIVSVLIEKVATFEKSSGWHWAVDALCQCTREAGNRIRVREEGGLPHLLALLRDEHEERLWLCSLASLLNFVYDEVSFSVLLEEKHVMVSALCDRLRYLVDKEKPAKHRVVPQACTSVKTEDEEAGLPVDSSNPTPSRAHWSSPRSGCYSPECSPPYWTSFPASGRSPVAHSPAAFSPEPIDAQDEFCYSPICEMDENSDDEEEEDDDGDSNFRSMTDSPAVSLAEEKQAEDEEDVAALSESERSPLGDILVLLSRISLRENPAPFLLRNGILFRLLLDYLIRVESPQPRAKRIILRIIRNPLCFEQLVLCRVPSEVLGGRLLRIDHSESECSSCFDLIQLRETLVTSLRLQAETAFGTGVILHLLVGKTEPEEKISAAIASTYLIKSSVGRRRVYLESTGLSVLTRALEDETNDFEEILQGLSFLIDSLIEPEFYAYATPICAPNVCQYSVKLSISDPVELSADGSESTLAVDRHFVGSKSEVLAAMLCGSFMESNKLKVHMRETSFDAIEYVVHYVYSCRSGGCPVISDLKVASLLQTLALADKLLMFDLKSEVADQITSSDDSVWESGTMTDTLVAAKLYNCPKLQRWVHLKAARCRPEVRGNLFKELAAADPQIYCDIQAMIAEVLQKKT